MAEDNWEDEDILKLSSSAMTQLNGGSGPTDHQLQTYRDCMNKYKEGGKVKYSWASKDCEEQATKRA